MTFVCRNQTKVYFMNYRDKEKQNLEIEIQQNIFKNKYFKENPIYFNELKNLCLFNPLGYSSLLRHSKKYLKEWVEESTPMLNDPFYKMRTKIYWVLTGLDDFPKCKTCGKQIIHKNAKLLNQSLLDFCSFRCQTLYFLDDINKKKIEKYGDIWNYKKCVKTTEERYGVSNCSKLSIFHKNRRSKYLYNNLYFDTKPELATYIYFIDHGYDIIYHPDKQFKYVFNGISHCYFPDFLIDNEYIEIKGDHFFNNEKMICPFRNKDWSDERYKLECDKYESKHQCMIANGVKIIKSDEYSEFILYVNNTYGKKYINTFRVDNSK